MHRLRNVSLYTALFLSGAAALVYQTAWGRMLQRVFGVSDLAIATVLASFFLGLGLGAAVGGRWGRRVKRPVLTYALLEAGIGLWAVLSLLLIPNVHGLYASLGAGASFETLTVIRLALSLAILLPPTILMGATLPVLIGAISRAEPAWGTPATVLYALNTFGAMAGAGATGFFLLPEIGTRASIVLAAVASLAAAGVVAAAWRAVDPGVPSAEPDAAPPAAEGRSYRHAELALVLAGVAGFAALASEVLWTRVLRTIVQGTTPAFAAMLVVYLFGIAAGSLVADRIARRGRSPLEIFGWAQTLLGVLTIVAIAITPHLPRLLALLRGDPTLEPHQSWTVLVLGAVLLLPIALTLGTAIPLAWAIARVPPEAASTHAGRVLAANTLGGLAGSLAAGFLMVPAIGVEASLLCILLIHLGTGALSFYARSDVPMRARLARMAAPVAVAVAALVASPSIALPFILDARNDPYKAIVEGPGADWSRSLLFLREGRNTTVSIVRAEDGTLRLYNDGRPESGFGAEEPGFGAELALLGLLPTLFAEERGRALVVGLGAGHTTTMLLAGPWERVDVVELEEAVVEAARVLHREHDAPFPLDDERAHLVVDDARARLVLARPESYDAIVSQPSHPWLAGSGALYTCEFFEEAKRVLRDGGVVALWINLFRADVETLRSVAATLLAVFPHGHAFVVEDSSFILVASEQPIPLGERVAERIEEGSLQPYVEPHRLDHVIDVATVRELDPAALRAFAEGAPILEDDRPALEFRLARTSANDAVSRAQIDEAAAAAPWISAEAFDALPAPDRVEVLIERLWEVLTRPVAIDRVQASLGALPLRPAERRYVHGAIAEARGDVATALAAYDAASTARAAYAADRLRLLERRHDEAIAVAGRRAISPVIARPLLSHAAALAELEAVRLALAAYDATADPTDRAFAEALRAYADGGCTALLGADGLDAEAREDEHLAFLAEGCALETRDRARAATFAELRTQSRRATAVDAADRGDRAARNGNRGGAEGLLRRSLAANPTHGGAAASLARLLAEAGRRDEARDVLLEAHRAAGGLPRAIEAVSQAAQELGIVLPP